MDRTFTDRLWTAIDQRVAEGNSIRSIARQAGIDHSVLSRFLRGQNTTELKSNTIDKLSKVIRMRVEL